MDKTSSPSKILKNFRGELEDIRARLPANIDVELWWQDEARVGQKTKLTRRWAPRGSRPMAPKDQRTKSAYIFGAICPQRGVGAGPAPDLNQFSLTNLPAHDFGHRVRMLLGLDRQSDTASDIDPGRLSGIPITTGNLLNGPPSQVLGQHLNVVRRRQGPPDRNQTPNAALAINATGGVEVCNFDIFW